MHRPWLDEYPPGVPATLRDDRPLSLVELLNASLSRYAERTAAVCMGAAVTYGELDAASQKLLAWLQSQGLAPGDRVALMMPNVPQYLTCLIAVMRAGCVVVNINPLYTPRELVYQLRNSGAKAIFILENFAATLASVLPQTNVKHVVVTSMGDMLGPVKGRLVNVVVRRVKKMVPAYDLPDAWRYKRILRTRAAVKPVPVAPKPNDLAFLQYTGGTTGVAKGAMLTHANIVANVEQVRLWFEPVLQTQSGPQRTIVSALPLYHIFALMCSLYGISTGMRNLLIPNPRDIAAFIKAMRRTKPDILPAVNTLFNALLNHPAFARLDTSPLKISLGGGMAVHEAVATKWKQATGKHILEAYGLSETSPGATINPVSVTEYNGTIGVPLPSTDVVILGANDQPVGVDEPGEIAIRGPQVMAGYWNMPDETAAAMTSDGFFKTGDIGVMDARGYVRIIDRKKDVILVSGFNVYPNEVEAVAAQHPAIVEAAAIGVADPHSGEAVKLFVVRKNAEVTADDVKAFCRQGLAPYKAPRYVEFRDELPKSNVGKILRRALRDEIAKP